MKVVAKLTMNRFPELSAQLQARAEQIVTKAAFDVEAEAKTVVPVDTGNLKNSIQTAKVEPLKAIVHTGTVEYAEYVEYGTSRMAAQPYMTPAAEAVRPAYHRAWQELLR